MLKVMRCLAGLWIYTEECIAENTNCGGNFIKFCWVPGSTGGTEIAVADCCYSQKSALKVGTEPSSLKSQSRSANTIPLPLMRLSTITLPWLWTGQSTNRGDQQFGQVRSYPWLKTQPFCWYSSIRHYYFSAISFFFFCQESTINSQDKSSLATLLIRIYYKRLMQT